jgi:hypothetical protein
MQRPSRRPGSSLRINGSSCTLFVEYDDYLAMGSCIGISGTCSATHFRRCILTWLVCRKTVRQIAGDRRRCSADQANSFAIDRGVGR